MEAPRLVLMCLMLLATPLGWVSAARADDTGKALALQTLAPGSAVSILGLVVYDSTGDDFGRLVDVLVDLGGRPKAGVVDVGGFMGVGARRVTVAWNLLRFSNKEGDARITVDLTHDEMAAAPEYRGADGSEIVTGRGKSRP